MNCGLQRACFFLLVILSVTGFAPSASAAPPQWIEVQSPHFSVITDAGEGRGREVATRFEQMRSVFGLLMSRANINTPIPLQIVAFRNSKELRQVVPLWHGKPVQLAGLFQGGQDRSFIMLDMSVENPWSVVFHEYAHQLMNGIITSQLDPWFEEGFAEYFSSIEVDAKEARVGKIPSDTYAIVQQQGLMKVAELFRVQQASATYNESGERRTVFYAESSMLVHYLYDNQLIPKLSTYFDLKIDKGVPVEEAIQQSFGMSAAQFDKTLRSYIASNHYLYYPLKTPADIITKGYTTRPLTAADGAAVIADIHQHSLDHHEEAMAEFEAVLKLDPANAAACRGLGYSYLQKNDYQKAGEYFKRAVAADPKDSRAHYYSALLSSGQGSFIDRSAVPEVLRELELAIALDPNLADAYSLQAFALAQSGSPEKGIAAMRKAVSLNPRNIGFRFNLAQMHLANQQTDQAIAIFRSLAKSSDEAIARRAQESLSQAERYRAALREAPSAAVIARTPPAEPASSLRESSVKSPPAADVVTLPEAPPVRFLKGTIQTVDCSAAPAATFTFISGSRTWKMLVSDSTHVLLLGADAFSCAWTKQKVALNFREAGDGAGTVVSIEIQ